MKTPRNVHDSIKNVILRGKKGGRDLVWGKKIPGGASRQHEQQNATHALQKKGKPPHNRPHNGGQPSRPHQKERLPGGGKATGLRHPREDLLAEKEGEGDLTRHCVGPHTSGPWGKGGLDVSRKKGEKKRGITRSRA